MKSVCCYPTCGSALQTRGLCRKHYAVARYRIGYGWVTEHDLLMRGLLLPKRTKPAQLRPPDNSDPMKAFYKGSKVKGKR